MKNFSLSSPIELSMPHLIEAQPGIVDICKDAKQVETTQQSSVAGAGELGKPNPLSGEMYA